MQGCAFKPAEPESRDALARHSSRAAAVACFFPPTDFLNYGKAGEVALGTGKLSGFKAPFDFRERDAKTGSFIEITDEAKRLEIGKQISPVYHVTKNSAPALIIHGDADKLVPIQQAELIIAKLKENQVPCELVVKKGADHGWPGLEKDLVTMAEWFDKYLK
jgi:dipeptidyl aminopeptidase/acylaminoacyl peptidase